MHMSYFLGTNSNSISMLFSGISGNAGNLTGNMISDYYSIRNGSYKKLLTSYYNKLNAADDKTNSNKTSASTNISIDSNAKLSQISSVSSKLQESSTNLLAKGSTSLFKTSEVKDENGNVTKEYDMDKIYKGVKEFVDNYNSVLSKASTSKVNSISKAVANMASSGKVNSNLLKSVGITVNDNNTLSVDEKKLKEADVSTLKILFNTSGSYGYYIGTKASEINATAKFEASKTNTYTRTGSYSSYVSTGNLYNSFY